MVKHFIRFLGTRSVLWVLVVVNLAGSIYGYYWYKNQLAVSPPHFLPFVPDSPTATLFITIVLVGYLLGKRWPLLEALAAVTLVKYGLWAAAINIGASWAGTQLSMVQYGLIISHLGMAIQGIVLAPYYRIRPWHLVVAALWTIHNDVIDYLFGIYPWVPGTLHPYISQIGYGTFWLSIFSIGLIYFIAVRPGTLKLKLFWETGLGSYFR